VSDDDCRLAVGRLNSLRLMRAESLGDGYDVSELCYDIDWCYSKPIVAISVSGRRLSHANRQGHPCHIYGRYDVSPTKLLGDFREFDTACSTVCAKHDDLARNTRGVVEKALAGTDTSDLRASFRRALSFSIPPLTLYRNHRPGAYSDLIFGVPLVDVETDEDNIPKVMKMCIEEVEKRGLNTKKIYSVS
jgi:hypothetical protein